MVILNPKMVKRVFWKYLHLHGSQKLYQYLCRHLFWPWYLHIFKAHPILHLNQDRFFNVFFKFVKKGLLPSTNIFCILNHSNLNSNFFTIYKIFKIFFTYNLSYWYRYWYTFSRTRLQTIPESTNDYISGLIWNIQLFIKNKHIPYRFFWSSFWLWQRWRQRIVYFTDIDFFICNCFLLFKYE